MYNFWKPTKDKDGCVKATIKILPGLDGKPFVNQFVHSFLDKKGIRLMCNCPTSIGENCPICDSNKSKDNEDVFTYKLYRLRRYIFNILVIDDPEHPENNGKVFLYVVGNRFYENHIKSYIFKKNKGDGRVYIEDGVYYDINFYKTKDIVLIGKPEYNCWLSYDNTKIKKSKYKVTDEILDSTYSLDEYLDSIKYKSYDELRDMFLGKPKFSHDFNEAKFLINFP